MINYYLITKPGIVLGNLVTLAAGFLLASKGAFPIGLFLAALFGLGLLIASACVFNNYIDRSVDKKMERTKNRPLAKALISGQNAILFGTVLGLLGNLVLWYGTNLLSLAIADVGFLIYVVPYSMWKCRTIYATAIGSVAGAIPPVVGYCAVSDQIDLGAVLLFAVLVLWQMPHFYAIAIYRYEDYKKAGILALPIVKGTHTTKIRMLAYIVGFMLASVLLTITGYTGMLFLATALFCSVTWIALALKGFNTFEDHKWGKAMFQYSLVIITAISIAIPL